MFPRRLPMCSPEHHHHHHHYHQHHHHHHYYYYHHHHHQQRCNYVVTRYWPPTKRMIVFESIFCGYWGHAGNFPGTPFADAAVNHSYFRVRDLDNGTVLANISGSIRCVYAWHPLRGLPERS